MTSQLDSGAAQAPATQWRDKKRYLWLFGLVPPTALFVMLPVIWAFNQFGWTTASQAFFWVGPFLIYVLLPTLDITFGRDGQNPPDEVMEYLENDKYYRYCTYIFIPFQYATVLFGAYAFTASNLSWLGLRRRPELGGQDRAGAVGRRARRHRHQHRPRDGSQEGVAGALDVQDQPGADLLRPLLHRAQPRPPRPRRHPGGPGVLALRRDLLGVPAAQRLGQRAVRAASSRPRGSAGRARARGTRAPGWATTCSTPG